MRPIWARNTPAPRGAGAALNALAEVEAQILIPLSVVMRGAGARNVDTESVRPIVEAAETDLIAGCDLARLGYFKQAYALWRAWFEQTFFALYFIESPLHRTAWRVVEDVEPGTPPPAKLMLHQLLNESSEGHPFAIVYDERFEALFAQLRVTRAKKDSPIKHAGHCLTDLSQGVHGTFSPPALQSEGELDGAVARYALPVLERSRSVVASFCFAFLHSLIAPSEQQLLDVRQPSFQPGDDEDAVLLHAMVPSLELWLQTLRATNTKGQQRG